MLEHINHCIAGWRGNNCGLMLLCQRFRPSPATINLSGSPSGLQGKNNNQHVRQAQKQNNDDKNKIAQQTGGEEKKQKTKTKKTKATFNRSK